MISLPVFFALIAGLFVLAFIYPYVIYPALLRYLPRKEQTNHLRNQDAEPLDVALLFCAYNEEAALPEKIENLRVLKAESPDLQILAYSDCSTDSTNDILLAADDILTPVISEERTGKGLGMRKLTELADADVLVFTDANVMVTPGSLPRLVEYFADPNIGAVAATLMYDNDESDGTDDDSATAQVGGMYWRLEERIKQLETRSGSMMGADGAFFARRKSGYPTIPPDMVDDMAVSMDVVFNQMRCVSAPDVIGEERSVTDSGEEFRRKRRIACRSYSTYRFMKDRLRQLSATDRFKFFSHKVMRWWGAYFLVGAIIAAICSLCAAGVGLPGTAILLVLMALFAYLGSKQIPLISALYEILLAVFATGIGVTESIFGGRYQFWDPATTR